MSTISTHVLNTASGTPAEGLTIVMERQSAGEWVRVGGGVTNDDGRVTDLLDEGDSIEEGIYRMTFETGSYFEGRQEQGFYPVVRVVFEVQAPDEHYHVPLLLSPFGYSTYRGS